MYPNPIFPGLYEKYGIGVYWYGVFIGIGILACLAVFFIYTKRKGMPEKVQDFTFYVVIAAIALGFLAAKLFQAFYNWIEDGVFDFYSAGFTAMGGFIGGAAVFLIVYFCLGKVFFKNEKKGLHVKEFNKTLCVAPICITIAHAFGRIGCLMAGCCYGKVSNSGFTIYNHGAERIPVQLYEALFLFALFGVLSYLFMKKRCNITMSIYLIAYGIWRFFIEFLRTDDRGAVVLGLAPSQWQSFIFVGIGVALIVFYLIKKIPLFLPKEKIETENVNEE